VSCAQYEKETLPNLYRRFLQVKAQALEVSDDQVIALAIKALCARPLHGHLVRERPKTVLEMYENFAKFSKSEVLHFQKLEQQRNVPKHDEASRPTQYRENRPHRNFSKHVNNIDSDGCDHHKNGKRISGHLRRRERKEHSTTEEITTTKEAACQTGGEAATKAHSSLHIACTMEMT
jgi:hypothetical protein